MTKDFEFLLHMQRLMFEMEALAMQYEVQDRFISIMFAGLINNEDIDEDESRLRAMYSVNVEDLDELCEVQEFINDRYQNDSKSNLDDDELNDLLDGTGVEPE